MQKSLSKPADVCAKVLRDELSPPATVWRVAINALATAADWNELGALAQYAQRAAKKGDPTAATAAKMIRDELNNAWPTP